MCNPIVKSAISSEMAHRNFYYYVFTGPNIYTARLRKFIGIIVKNTATKYSANFFFVY